MDIIRDSLKDITERYQYEMSVEHFVLPNGFQAPTEQQYNEVAPYFKPYGVSPQDAYNVLMSFDMDPATLPKNELDLRVKLLNVLLTVLNDPNTSKMILDKYFGSPENRENRDIPQEQLQNMKGFLNLVKRMVKLLILEATTANEPIRVDGGNSGSMEPKLKMVIAALLVVIAVLGYMLYKK